MKLNVTGGITADVSLAQSWYEKAKNLGSPAAPERLERLARLPE
jgi:TPR repeat protein